MGHGELRAYEMKIFWALLAIWLNYLMYKIIKDIICNYFQTACTQNTNICFKIQIKKEVKEQDKISYFLMLLQTDKLQLN